MNPALYAEDDTEVTSRDSRCCLCRSLIVPANRTQRISHDELHWHRHLRLGVVVEPAPDDDRLAHPHCVRALADDVVLQRVARRAHHDPTR